MLGCTDNVKMLNKLLVGFVSKIKNIGVFGVVGNLALTMSFHSTKVFYRP